MVLKLFEFALLDEDEFDGPAPRDAVMEFMVIWAKLPEEPMLVAIEGAR